jgi:hypothetical protein
MNLSILFSSFLVLHLLSLVLLAGTTVVDFIGYQNFWRILQKDKTMASGVLEFLRKLNRLLGIGGALIVVSGMAMMIITHGVFGQQTWFRIKFALVLILIGNGIFSGRRLAIGLKKILSENTADPGAQMRQARTGLNRFHIIQLSIIVVIVFLSVFKFN